MQKIVSYSPAFVIPHSQNFQQNFYVSLPPLNPYFPVEKWGKLWASRDFSAYIKMRKVTSVRVGFIFIDGESPSAIHIIFHWESWHQFGFPAECREYQGFLLVIFSNYIWEWVQPWKHNRFEDLDQTDHFLIFFSFRKHLLQWWYTYLTAWQMLPNGHIGVASAKLLGPLLIISLDIPQNV